MKNVKHIVFVKHNGCDKIFLFAVPSWNTIKKGTNVLVETMYGNKEAVCVTESFFCDPHTVDCIIQATGAYTPLKNVIGVVKEVTTTKVEPIEMNELPF